MPDQIAPLTSFTASELLEMDLPEPRWAVPGLIPEGLTFLGGKPKVGKSWLAIDLCLAVCSGGEALGLEVEEPRSALYLALEDTPRRLQDRLRKILNGKPAPEKLHIFTEFPRLDESGLTVLESLIKDHPDLRLVVIDTFAKVRPFGNGTRSDPSYLQDYNQAEQIKRVAVDCGVAIVLVHHLRKNDSEDQVDSLSGTLGLAGAADGLMILKKGRGRADAELFVTGRDVEEQEYALSLEKATMTWKIIGQASEYRKTPERQKILEVLRGNDGPMGPKEIAEKLGYDDQNNVSKLLGKMFDAGEVRKVGYGQYQLPDALGDEGDQTDQSGQS